MCNHFVLYIRFSSFFFFSQLQTRDRSRSRSRSRGGGGGRGHGGGGGGGRRGAKIIFILKNSNNQLFTK